MIIAQDHLSYIQSVNEVQIYLQWQRLHVLLHVLENSRLIKILQPYELLMNTRIEA